MRKVLFLFALILLLACAPRVSAQDDALRVTLDQAVSLALAESYSAQVLQLDLLRAEQNARAARGRFGTSADLDFDAPSYDQSFRDVQLPGQPSVFEQTSSLDWRAALRVNQPLPTNGSLSLTGSMRQLQRDTFLDSADSTREDNRFFLSMRLGFSQPLFVPNDLKLGRERAELELERSRMRYTRTQLDVVYNVSSVFYSLFRAQRQRDIAEEARDQQKRSHEVAKRKFEAGLIPEVEALQQEVDLASSESALFAAEGALARARDNFKLAVGIDMEGFVIASLGEGSGTDLQLDTFEVDPELAREQALSQRMEVREQRLNRRLAEITLEETDAQRSIRGTVDAFYDFSGISSDDLLTENSPFDLFDSSWTDLRDRPNNKGVSFSLSIPLWDSGVNAAQVAAARATLAQRELDEEENRRQVIREVNAALTQLEEARQRFGVLRRSETVAERSYEISRARFDNGEITSQELALDRDRLTSARSATLDAFISVQLAVADLQRQTLYDFERGRSLAEG